MTPDVVCFGELFIDLTPQAHVNGQWLFAPSPGGAPGNVAVGLAKLGHKVLMISRVGADAFSTLLLNALRDSGVDASGVQVSDAEKTGLSIVTLDERGDRSFMFYHDMPADQNIGADAVTASMLADVRILHAGVLPLASSVSAGAQRKAMDLADKQGALISCDVNFRPGLWHNVEDMLAAGREMISRAAIVKVSEEELLALNGPRDMTAAVHALWHDRLQLFSVTRGEKGAVLYSAGANHVCNGFRVNAVDSTGAGDAYTASILSGVLAGETPDALVRRACAAGALATTRKGAMESLPTTAEITALLASS